MYGVARPLVRNAFFLFHRSAFLIQFHILFSDIMNTTPGQTTRLQGPWRLFVLLRIRCGAERQSESKKVGKQSKKSKEKIRSLRGQKKRTRLIPPPA
uniref:Uncharacterized protein n=1 Tax=Utricularia reniformis TaxID=192314 RepID=A0A1Y0B2F1_9LAMI|nr:hypothetical protein AEK19_MT1331 [Utricularia reniformis]ART31529.1 hypothetical protein AEK19_MT1331 [Utricularia reniformis]